jgi:hypothetical protein
MMNYKSIAPCGLICDLCLGYQREKNTCVGCNNEGNKPYHCTKCSIKLCPEKKGNSSLLCNECSNYPCRRLKDLDKRYRLKHGESLIENFKNIKGNGFNVFIAEEKKKWECPHCGKLLCAHKEKCVHCGGINKRYPKTS